MTKNILQSRLGKFVQARTQCRNMQGAVQGRLRWRYRCQGAIATRVRCPGLARRTDKEEVAGGYDKYVPRGHAFIGDKPQVEQ